ncbi:MAG: peptide deformylase [Alphaproteobacteria bacterium]|nr:peptide deformylase [Alphaproteobacteria bacterium]
MAILKIARMGHPILKEKAKPIDNISAPEITRLIHDMLETLADSRGIGLAAPQVYCSLRLMMFMVPKERMDNNTDVPLTILINPEFTPLSEEKELGWEGCLSVPGFMGKVPRYTHIKYRGQTPKGEWIEQEAKDYHARVFQHEYDHLDGILYPMRMTDLTLLGFREEMTQYLDSGEEVDE